MSDILWVAIAGITGTAATAVFSGLLTYRLQAKRLDREAQESRRTRLIAARSEPLDKLRDVIGTVLATSDASIKVVARLHGASTRGDMASVAEETAKLGGVIQTAQSAFQSLQHARAQIADAALEAAILRLVTITQEVTPDIYEAVSNMNVSPMDGRAARDGLAKLEAVDHQLLEQTRLVNRRMENLLAGEESSP